jgi:hypothetical protein
MLLGDMMGGGEGRGGGSGRNIDEGGRVDEDGVQSGLWSCCLLKSENDMKSSRTAWMLNSLAFIYH